MNIDEVNNLKGAVVVQADLVYITLKKDGKTYRITGERGLIYYQPY